MAKARATRLRLDETSWAYPGWTVTAASAAGVFVSFASLFVSTFGIFLKPLTQEFSWSREDVSLAFSIAAVVFGACSPMIGYLLDRFESKLVILPCLLVFGCSFASLSLLTPRIWRLYVIFVIMGAAGTGTAQMAYSRAVCGWFESRRGLALAILMAGSAAGAVVLPPMAQVMISAMGWRAAYAVLGAAALAISLPAAALFVRDKPEMRQGGAAGSGASLRQGLGSRAFWILMSVLFLASIGHNGAITHLSAILTDRGVPVGSAALAVSALGAGGLCGRLITGWLIDRFFAPYISVALLTLAALGVFLLSLAHSAGGGVCAAMLIGVGMGGEADIIPYLISRYFGLRSFAKLYGLMWAAYATAAAIGPALMGRAFDAKSSYESLIVGLSALMLAAAILMLMAPRYGPEGWRILKSHPFG